MQYDDTGLCIHTTDEYVRIQLAQLLLTIVQVMHEHNTLMHLYINDILSIIFEICQHDKCNDILCGTYNSITQLYSIESLKAQLYPISKRLCSHIIPSLSGSQSRVKVSAIQCIDQLVCNGASESIHQLTGFIPHNIVDLNILYSNTDHTRINYFALLINDGNTTTRTAFYNMLHRWVYGSLHERYDYDTLIMSYYLSGLYDNIISVQQLCYTNFIALGTQYELNYYDELKDQLHYIESIIDIHTIPLIHPFTVRPGLGCRLIGRKYCDRLIYCICSEITQTLNQQVQYNSIQLLRILQCCTEEYITKYIVLVYDALLPICINQPIQSTIQHCIELLGYHSDVSILYTHIMDELRGEININALYMLQHIIHASKHNLIETQLYELLILFQNNNQYKLVYSSDIALHYSQVLHCIVCCITMSDQWIQDNNHRLYELCMSNLAWITYTFNNLSQTIKQCIELMNQCINKITRLHCNTIVLQDSLFITSSTTLSNVTTQQYNMHILCYIIMNAPGVNTTIDECVRHIGKQAELSNHNDIMTRLHGCLSSRAGSSVDSQCTG